MWVSNARAGTRSWSPKRESAGLRWFYGQMLFTRQLEVPARQGRANPDGIVTGFFRGQSQCRGSYRSAQACSCGVGMLAAEQKRANDLYAEVNQVALAPARNMTELQP